MSTLCDALARLGMPTPPAHQHPASGKFVRYGPHQRYWFRQGEGVALFGDWVTGESGFWFEDARTPYDPAQSAARKATLERLRAEQAAEQERTHTEVAARCAQHWESLPTQGQSPYLEGKQVAAYGLRFEGNAVIVPLRDAAGTLWSLQTITAEGTKRFEAGGRKRGCFHTIGAAEGAPTLLIAEGYATAASLHAATGLPVLVAFDAGNLEPVTQAWCRAHPETRLLLAADNDCWKPESGNIGKAKAEAAAALWGAQLVLPKFQDGAGQPTDFNDLAQREGLEAVRQQVQAALKLCVAEPAQACATTPTVEQLAALPPLEYEKIREVQAKRMGVRVSALDEEVRALRKTTAPKRADAGLFPDVPLWPHPVDAGHVLSQVEQTIRRFIVCEKEVATATALWCAFTWMIEHVQVAPLAVITAPEKRCGKSQLLDVIGRLSCKPLVASNISPAATFRVIEAHHPTLLIDEADTFFKDNEELRGVINSGHTRPSAYVIRNVGDHHEPKQFSTWGAKAISGIGSLSDTLMDRAILLTLRRKLPHETVARLRHAEVGLFEGLASQLARLAADTGERIARARPALPDALNDRAQDNWEPLLAIADLAGGDWPQRARTTACTLSGVEQEAPSLSAELLADIRDVFDTKGVVRISSADLIRVLCEDDEKSWASYNRGQPMKPRQLAKRLGEYGIASKTIRIGYDTPKGFDRAQFDDAFIRYLAPPPCASATPPHHAVFLENPVADTGKCCATHRPSETRKPALTLACGGVADFPPPAMGDSMVEVML